MYIRYGCLSIDVALLLFGGDMCLCLLICGDGAYCPCRLP